MRELLCACSCPECDHTDQLCPEHRAQAADLLFALAWAAATTPARTVRAIIRRARRRT